MTSLSETITTLAPDMRGTIRAAELNLCHPCRVDWCSHDCAWEADSVGGCVTRLHGRELPGGNQISSLEQDPDLHASADTQLPCLYLTKEHENAGVIRAELANLIAELTTALWLMSTEAKA